MNHYIVYLWHTILYLNYTSIKKLKKILNLLWRSTSIKRKTEKRSEILFEGALQIKPHDRLPCTGQILGPSRVLIVLKSHLKNSPQYSQVWKNKADWGIHSVLSKDQYSRITQLKRTLIWLCEDTFYIEYWPTRMGPRHT